MPVKLLGDRSSADEDADLHVSLHGSIAEIRAGDKGDMCVGDSALGVDRGTGRGASQGLVPLVEVRAWQLTAEQSGGVDRGVATMLLGSFEQ